MMTHPHSRRLMLSGTIGMLMAACGAPRPESRGVPGDSPSEALARLEARVGGRVGVFAVDTRTGKSLGFRPDERFAMCSTFKWVLAATVLAQVDAGRLALGERISYGPADLLEYAPITGAHVAQGAMTVEALARAAVIVSDNTAANLLLAKLGGPSAVTQFARSHGDGVTRLDRNEPALNDRPSGDPRDTTTPRAMVELMRRVLGGEHLRAGNRERLLGWLRDCETGKERLRAGLPRDWIVGDKTGSGPRGAFNDVAIAWPPGRPPILVAAYMSGSKSPMNSLNAAHAEIGRRVAVEL